MIDTRYPTTFPSGMAYTRLHRLPRRRALTGSVACVCHRESDISSLAVPMGFPAVCTPKPMGICIRKGRAFNSAECRLKGVHLGCRAMLAPAAASLPYQWQQSSCLTCADLMRFEEDHTCLRDSAMPMAAVMMPQRKHPKDTMCVRSTLFPTTPLIGELNACIHHITKWGGYAC